MAANALAMTAQMCPNVSNCLRRLRRTNPVRLAALQIASGGSLSDQDIRMLTQTVQVRRCGRWREHVVACWCLGLCRLTINQYASASAALRDVMTLRRMRDVQGNMRRGLAWSALAGVTLGVTINTLFTLLNSEYDGFTLSDLGYGLSLSLLLSVLFYLPSLGASFASDVERVRLSVCEAARSLGRLRDPLSAGLLASAAAQGSGPLAEVACEALPEVLKAIRHDHYTLLPREATPALCCAAERTDENLAVQILDALGRAGSGAAAGPVRRMANASPSERVRKQAALVLPILEERLRQETSAARLLRPAEAPGAPRDILLRPASSATSVPEEQLLRPSSGPVDGSV